MAKALKVLGAIVLAMAALLTAPVAAAQDGGGNEDEIVVAVPNPPLWRLHDADSEVYILATVSALPRRTTWNKNRLRRLLAGADAFLIEDRLFIGPATILRLFTTRRTALLNPHGGRVSELVDPALWERVRENARAVDKDADDWQRFRPYVVGASLMNAHLEQLGLDTRIDVAQEARELARRARVRIVEAPIAQVRAGPLIDTLSELPPGADAPCLEDQLTLSETAPAIMAQRAAAWVSGDAAALHSFADVIDTSRCITALAAGGGLNFEDLGRRRVEGWAAYLRAELERPGRRVAVLDGDLFLSRDGVLAQLTRAGYEIEVIE